MPLTRMPEILFPVPKIWASYGIETEVSFAAAETERLPATSPADNRAMPNFAASFLKLFILTFLQIKSTVVQTCAGWRMCFKFT